MRVFISIIFAILFVLSGSSSVSASMAMPQYGINEQTRECSKFFMGDECVSCTMPEGWQMIGVHLCPAGYKEIQKNSVCTPRKTSFCCTVSHSGARGDCEDVVVNDVEKKCAFVEDINKCSKLPTNWNQAGVIDFWGRVCPSHEYEWLEETLDCGAKIIEKNISDNQKNITDDKDKQERSSAIPIVGIFTVIIILLIILWFFLIRRKK